MVDRQVVLGCAALRGPPDDDVFDLMVAATDDRLTVERHGSLLIAEGDSQSPAASHIRPGERRIAREANMQAGGHAVEWDENARALRLVRDHAGAGPLYFRVDRDHVAFSTCFGPLNAVAPREDPNVDWLVEWRLLCYLHLTHTLHPDIHQVPAGHACRFARDQQSIQRVWDPWLIPVRQDMDLQVASSEALRLLRLAVRRQAAGQQHVGIALSGGLDSSAVLAVLRDTCPELRIVAYSFAHPHPDLEPDMEAARHLTDELGVPLRLVDLERVGLDYGLEDLSRARGGPPFNPHGAFLKALHDQAASDGVQALWSGEGGDDAIGMGRHVAHSEWRSGKVVSAIRRTVADAGPKPRRIVSRLRAVSHSRIRLTPVHWLDGRISLPTEEHLFHGPCSAALAGSLPDPLRARGCPPGRPAPTDEDMQRWWWANGTSSEIHKGWTQLGNLPISMPLVDRRLAEWSLHVPARLRRHRGHDRWFLRAAMARLLPEPVRLRRRKSMLDGCIRERLAAWDQEHPTLENLPVSRADELFPTAAYASALGRWKMHQLAVALNTVFTSNG